MDTATQQVLTPREIAGGLAASIIGKRQERLEKRAQEPPWKPRRHYASNLNGCARQLTYAITHYTEREPFTAEAVAHMEDGKHEEKLLLAELEADGFEVVEGQVKLDDDRYWITGVIDAKIRWQGLRIPIEVKRISPFALEKIDSVDDMRADPYLIDKVRQLTLYLYLHSIEVGLFYLSDGRGARKVIVVPLDYAFAETILKDLDVANNALRRIEGGVSVEEALPPRIPYHSKICGRCNFRKTCLPDMTFGEGVVLGGDELKDAVAQYLDLKPKVVAFEKLKKEIKGTVEGKPLVSVGDFLIEGRWAERKMPAQVERIDKYWRWDVQQAANGNDEARQS